MNKAESYKTPESTDINTTFKHDQDPKEAIRQWSKKIVGEWYESASVPEQDEVEEKIAELTGETEDRQQGFLKPAYREGVKIFFDVLLDFMEERADQPSEKRTLEEFIASLQQHLFSWSPNLANEMGTDNLFMLTAKANRISAAQGWFGQTMVGELVYELSFCNESVIQDIEKSFEIYPVADLLDLIQQLQTIAADAVAQGDWAAPALSRVYKLLVTLSRSRSRLVQYSAFIAIDRVKEEESNPSLGVLTYYGNKAAGRLQERFPIGLEEDSKKLGDRLQIESPIPNGRFLQVASDAIAVFDHTNSPRMITYAKEILTPGGKDEVQLAESKIHFESYKSLVQNKMLNPFPKEDKELPLLLRHLHDPKIRVLFYDDMGIDLTSIPLRSQIHFLRYVAGEDRDKFWRVAQVLHKNKESENLILNSFLANAEDKKYGDAILDIAEKLPPEAVRAVFSKYKEIADSAEKASDYLADVLDSAKGLKTGEEPEKRAAVKRLLHNANEFLLATLTQGNIDSEKLLADLKNVQAETVLFASVVHALQKEGIKIDIEMLRGASLRLMGPRDLSPADLAQMRDIYERNYVSSPVEFREDILDNFAAAISSPERRPWFYVLKHNNSIVAFCGFEREQKRKEGDNDAYTFYGSYLHFFAFNVNPEYRGNRIGEVLMEKSLDLEVLEEGDEVRAECSSREDICSKYIERGFVATRWFNYKGKPSFNIAWDTNHNRKLESKSFSQEEIADLGYEDVEDVDGLESYVSADWNTGRAAIYAYRTKESELFPMELLKKGYELTRYFRHDGMFYAVFEYYPKEELEPLVYII